MKRIISSAVVLITGIAVLTIGGTGAFFSDTEKAVGNTFVAGAIDLKIDNESYYNGAVSTTTTWLNPSDLGQGLLFFNFQDLKPDDEGEDTISLHVNNNDAYACMDVSLTSNDDKSSTEPELGTPDAQDDINNTWDGELAQNVQMFWWADDGDNVYEQGENALSNGVQTLQNLASTTGAFSVSLADATHNVWNPNSPGPITGDKTVYIGKAWCFGNLSLDAVAQDGLGHTGTNGPLSNRGGGFSCDGKSLNNLTQTDGATLDVTFRAIQSRNNSRFMCKNEEPRLAKITVIKHVVNDNGGNNDVPDFQLFVIGNVATQVTSGITTTISAGNYVVTEDGVPGYKATFSGDCDVAGNISLNSGDDKTCTITNDDIAPNITLHKIVIKDNPSIPIIPAVAFPMLIDGSVVPQNTSVSVTANSAHTINETQQNGYHFVSITGNPKCPGVLGGLVTLDEGEAITCNITNDDN